MDISGQFCNHSENSFSEKVRGNIQWRVSAISATSRDIPGDSGGFLQASVGGMMGWKGNLSEEEVGGWRVGEEKES